MVTDVLPLADTEEQYDAIDEAELRAGVLALCQHLGLTGEVVAFDEGSLPVYAVGDDLVIKLYPPLYLDELPIERDVLSALEGHLSIPTPGAKEAGEFHGWGYILMDRLHGEDLKRAWPKIPRHERERLARQLGKVLAELHAITPPDVLGPPDWAAFRAERAAATAAQNRRRGLDQTWLDQIPAFLDSVDLEPGEPVLLHTEFMNVHVLVQEEAGAWRLSGLFDFEPAMRGAREYDLVAVGIFLTRGDRSLMRTFLDGYGYPEERRAALPRKVMAYALLHVYSHLPWYFREVPASGATTFDELADRWFGVQESPSGGQRARPRVNRAPNAS
ncbi:aminoglycoside 3'-phosphotransferase/choline kinase family protein [Microtetraspora sp. NBRC 16547]|uniref:phosphotransferase family protein n=1 Tax=Microtetraspora sp. NBRC 16547 TaxID=3030993 RepID=UPI0024A44CED|nr:aminoglycoside 3'-phosphotransferase/choline kinase family protein [Microtetraspora sp. NBRC 16547]GLW98013.1 phosphotransferase [Microtetraspora sp. NBRC 16547]